MRKSAEIDQITAALVAIQAEVGTIPKDASNPFFKSKYADLPAVIEKAGPIVTKHGVAVTQWMDCLGKSQDGTDRRDDTLTTLVSHVSGQWIEATTVLHLVKDDPQAHGSAVTYARRYGYMAALGLVADVDDDGNQASFQQSQVQKPQNAQRPQAPKTTRKPPPPPVTEAEAVAKLEEAFGPNQEIVVENLYQRSIYGKARKLGITGAELDELCVASVGCRFNEVDSPEKANTVLTSLQAQEQVL